MKIEQLEVIAYSAGGDVKIEAVKQRDGTTRWAVRDLIGDCLGSDGWEYEPSPSERDAEFFQRCRYDTPQAALDALTGHRGE